MSFNETIEERYLPDCPEERCLRGLAWYDNLAQRESTIRAGGGYQAPLPHTVRDQFASTDDPLRRARVIAVLLRMEIVIGHYQDPTLLDMGRLMVGVAAGAS